VLAQTVQAWIRWQLGSQPEVLALENNVGRRRVEECFVVAATDDGEAERIRNVLEFELCSDRVVLTRTRQDRLGDLVDLICRILNFDMQALICRQLA